MSPSLPEHRPKGCSWPRARSSADSPSTSGWTAALRPQPLRQGAPRGGGPEAVGAGRHRVTFRFERREPVGGQATLEVDGATVAEGTIPVFTVAAFSATGAGLTCGYELGPAVGEDYRAPFACTASIHSATVTLSEHVPVNPLVEFERIMAEQ